MGHLGWLFKLNPHPRHQHCTDEAQKAETVLSTVIYRYIYIYFCHGHVSDRMFLQLNFHWNPFIAGYRSLESVAVLSINMLAIIEVFSFDAIVY